MYPLGQQYVLVPDACLHKDEPVGLVPLQYKPLPQAGTGEGVAVAVGLVPQ